jgi:hypothetical protein
MLLHLRKQVTGAERRGKSSIATNFPPPKNGAGGDNWIGDGEIHFMQQHGYSAAGDGSHPPSQEGDFVERACEHVRAMLDEGRSRCEILTRLATAAIVRLAAAAALALVTN